MATKFKSEDNGLWLHQGDAFKWLKKIPDESVDLFVTDYPYESLEKHRKVGTTTRLKDSKSSSNEWFGTVPNSRATELLFEAFRVLKKDRHAYLFCDDETSDVLKVTAFNAVKEMRKDQKMKGKITCWKRIVWDKCLHPDTCVITGRGVLPAKEVRKLDYVWGPDGRWSQVSGTRSTWSSTVTMGLSDGTSITCSPEHRFVVSGEEREAKDMSKGMKLESAPSFGDDEEFSSWDMAVHDDLIARLPMADTCWWCGKEFDSPRAAAAHQSRWCEKARSLTEMATELGVPLGRLQYWTNRSQIPLVWAQKLGIEGITRPGVRLYHQNDTTVSFPDKIKLTYDLGRFVGLFAAEGSFGKNYLSFGFNVQEKHLQNHVMSVARSFHASCTLNKTSPNGVSVRVNSKFLTRMMSIFVGGNKAPDKFFWPRAHSANSSFVRGVSQGLIEGDGSWSDDEGRWTYTSASRSLALFILRSMRSLGHNARISPYRENDHSGFWRVRWDPKKMVHSTTHVGTEVISIERNEIVQPLVDLSVTHQSQLYTLGNGTLTHNCAIGMGYHYRARYEFILFFEKGKRKLNNLGIPDVLSFKRIRSKDAYPTEKPPELLQVLIENSTEPGDLVIDPFMGSGSAGEAALGTGRHFWGNDIAPSSLTRSVARLEPWVRTGEFG